MWIKRSLVIVPILLLLFLLQSVFWVPGTSSAANDPSRLDRLVWYMGATPEDMNDWQSTSATDSTISVHFGEGLLRYSEMYQIEPWLADEATVNHEVEMLVPEAISDEALEAAVRRLYGTKFGEIARINDWKLVDSEKWLAAKADPALSATVAFAEGARKVRITLNAKPAKGRIESAVAPNIVDELSEALGQAIHAAIDAKMLVAGLDDSAKGRLAAAIKEEDASKLEPSLAAVLTAAGLNGAAHFPLVEFKIKKGVRWVDGPFWTDRKRVWQVIVNGEEAGYYNADTAEEAIETVRTRLSLGADASFETWQFGADDTFGEEGGPWWGRGPEFTSRDVKRTIELLQDNDFASPRMSSWADVKEVRTFDDPHRVQVVYRVLYSPAISNLTGNYLPYHHWNDTAWTAEAVRKGRGPRDVGVAPENYKPAANLRAKVRDYSRKPSSIGPMVLYPLNGEEVPLWENGKLVRLMRNEFYWGRKPEYKWLDYYIFNPQMGAETAEMVFTTGGIDLYGADPHQVRRYEAYGDRFTAIQRRTTTYAYIGFNTERAPVNDKLVRKALAMALDVDKIIEYIVWGQGERISGPGYPVLPWYDHDYTFEHQWRSGDKKGQTEKLKFVPHDQTEARALLEEAGYDFSSGIPVKDGKPLELTITMHTGNPIRRDIALLAQQEWQRLGVKVTLDEHEWNVYLSQYIRPRNFTVCVLGWSGGLDFDKRQLWHSSALPPRGLNFASFKSAEADKVMEDILKEYDFDKQVEMSHRMFRLIADELPYIFLYSGLTTTVVDPRVVWRKEVEVDGVKKVVDRPLKHKKIADARAAFTYWMYEFKRVPEVPQWTEDDYRD